VKIFIMVFLKAMVGFEVLTGGDRAESHVGGSWFLLIVDVGESMSPL